MVLLQSRGALSSTKDALHRSERSLTKTTGELDAERARSTALDAELSHSRDINETLEAQHASDVERNDELTSRVDELQTHLEDAVDARSKSEIAVAEREQALAAAAAEINQHQETAAASDQLNLALTHQTEELQVQLIEAADEAAKRTTPSVPTVLVTDDGSDLDVPGFSPGMAWELELVRSERTWRYSVAANPVEDPSPFGHAENPLKLAIEIEALALREDVGAFIGIDWQAGTDIDPEADPARAHLTLRLAQELLASAARELSPSTLIVTSDESRGGVSLEVVASDPNDVDFKIPPPPIASEWIGIDEHGGMIVTVRSAD